LPSTQVAPLPDMGDAHLLIKTLNTTVRDTEFSPLKG
jgi:hypothetical protein